MLGAILLVLHPKKTGEGLHNYKTWSRLTTTAYATISLISDGATRRIDVET